MLKTHVEAGCYATYATYLERRLTITKYVFGQENYIWRNFEFVTIIEFKNNDQKYFTSSACSVQNFKLWRLKNRFS